MSKVLDITDKLSFELNPRLKLGKIEVEVNAGAETMLRVIGAFGKENTNEMQAISEVLDLLFTPQDKERICALESKGKKLDSESLMVIINEAIGLVTGKSEGEA